MQAFRKGDLVAVQGTVSFEPFETDRVLVELPGQFQSTIFQARDLALVRPFFAAGEEVVFADDPEAVFSIVAANGDWAWVRCRDNAIVEQGFVVSLCELRPAPMQADGNSEPSCPIRPPAGFEAV